MNIVEELHDKHAEEKRKRIKLENLLTECLPILISGKTCVEYDKVAGRVFFSCKDCGAEGWGPEAKHKPGCSLGELIKRIKGQINDER